MLNFRKTPLLFSVFIVVLSFFHFSYLSKSYASQELGDDEEKQTLVLNNHSQPISGYESLKFPVSDSEEEDLKSPISEQRIIEDDGECHRCCLGYYHAIPWWTDTIITGVLVVSSIVMPVITYVTLEESTRLTLGTIGSFITFSGVTVKAYRWCILGSIKDA